MNANNEYDNNVSIDKPTNKVEKVETNIAPVNTKDIDTPKPENTKTASTIVSTPQQSPEKPFEQQKLENKGATDKEINCVIEVIKAEDKRMANIPVEQWSPFIIERRYKQLSSNPDYSVCDMAQEYINAAI